jgi:hypothetical protein
MLIQIFQIQKCYIIKTDNKKIIKLLNKIPTFVRKNFIYILDENAYKLLIQLLLKNNISIFIKVIKYG